MCHLQCVPDFTPWKVRRGGDEIERGRWLVRCLCNDLVGAQFVILIGRRRRHVARATTWPSSDPVRRTNTAQMHTGKTVHTPGPHLRTTQYVTFSPGAPLAPTRNNFEAALRHSRRFRAAASITVVGPRRPGSGLFHCWLSHSVLWSRSATKRTSGWNQFSRPPSRWGLRAALGERAGEALQGMWL